MVDKIKIRQAYNQWAALYDLNQNKTRDLEVISLRSLLNGIYFENCLEIGCGTGKNTEWLITRAKHVTAVDLSEEMLAIAIKKIRSDKVLFIQADITKTWNFIDRQYDLATFSLVLEHIQSLDEIFQKLFNSILPKGYVYIGELHPFKQYMGTKARFEKEGNVVILDCYTHPVSEFTRAAINNGFSILEIDEFWDKDDANGIPRIFAMLLRKK